MNSDQENNLKTHSWWVVSRPYRVAGELVFYSIILLGFLLYVLSKATDDSSFRMLQIQPIYWVGIFAGGLGGCARGLLDFWRRESFNLSKKDYWKHALPFYVGVLFGFLMVLVMQATLKVVGVPHNVADSGGLSFLAMVCMFSGLFADSAEKHFIERFKDVQATKSK